MFTIAEVADNLLYKTLNAMLNGVLVVEAIRNAQHEAIDFQYIFLNKTAREQATVLKHIEIGATMQAILAPTDCKNIILVCQAVLLTGKLYEGERYYSDTGEWFNTHISKLNDEQLVITFTNITAFKQAVLEHQQQAELFQSVLGSNIDPVVVCKPICNAMGNLTDLQLVMFNAAAQDAWLFSAAFEIGGKATELLPELECNVLLDFCRKAYETGETQRFQYRYPTSERWLSVAVKRFNQGLILNATDITADRQQQYALLNMNRALQQSNDNLQQFAYIASHDLQEPLRKIHSFGNLLQSQFGEQLGSSGADLIIRMQLATGRMTTLIQDLLTYSRLTTHTEPFKPVSLGRLLNEIIDDLTPLLEEGRATTHCDELPTVPGDITQLRQLFQNILVNAVTYRHPDRPARVHVRCQTLSAAEIPAELPSHKQYVEISLTDNGIGFDEKYRDRIFQMFQRLHGRNQYSGTGVGLAICKRVVENHQGYITANSVPGQGSTFRVVLPL